MICVTHIKALPGYTLSLTFNDGTAGTVCLADRLFGPMFEPLIDEAFFACIGIDEFGAPFWPNGADLSPDALHQQVCALATQP